MLKKHGSNLDAEGNNDEKMKMKNRNIETLTSIHNAFIVTPISKANRNVAFIRPPAVTRRALWIRICPSFHLKVFLGLTHYFFEKLSLVLGVHILLSVKQKYFCPKMGKMGLKWARKRFFFLNLLENVIINFFWFWSVTKIYIICSFLAQILYLIKIWFLRYGPKCFWPIRLQDF